MRFAGLTLSALFSYGLTGWGGAALVNVARSFLAHAETSATQTAVREALNPEGRLLNIKPERWSLYLTFLQEN